MLTDHQHSTDIVTGLYNAGHSAYERRELDTAQNYFTQCLYALLQSGGASDSRLLALVLFSLGRAIAYRYRAPETAIACCEASASVQRLAGRGEAETDRIYMAGTVVGILEDHAAARRLLQTALDRYRQLGHAAKTHMVQNDLREMKERLGENRYRQITNQTGSMSPHRFVIYQASIAVYELIVTRDGVVEHHALVTSSVNPTDSDQWAISYQRG